jgi:glycosyl transferase family 25
MKAYVITLKDPDAAPLQDLAQAIREAGLEPVIVPGVLGRDLPASVYYDMVVPHLGEGGSLLLPSEVGCAMSHHEVYRRLLVSGEPQAVVLEDDVLAGPEDWARVADLARIPLEGRAFLHLGGMDGFRRWKRKVRSKAAGAGVWEIHPKDVGYFGRTVGYIVPQATAGA